jgi:peptide chain release factor 1
MSFRRLLQLPVIVNRLVRRNYYSDNVKKLYFNKINNYIREINKSENDEESGKLFYNLMNDYDFVSKSIAEIEKETSPENKIDEEMMTLMDEEKVRLEKEKSELIDKIFNEVYEYEQSKDSERISGNSDCIFEISAGVGGKEAMLFADELCAMYNNYFNYKNWELESVHSDSDGMYLRHYKATVKGHFVWDHLRYEIGVHRVQRIPKTESRGR